MESKRTTFSTAAPIVLRKRAWQEFTTTFSSFTIYASQSWQPRSTYVQNSREETVPPAPDTKGETRSGAQDAATPQSKASRIQGERQAERQSGIDYRR